MSKLIRRNKSSLLTEVFFGIAGGGAGAQNLGDLLDVDITSANDQDILVFDAAQNQWVNRPISDFTSSPADPNFSIQFNNNGDFGGSSAFVYRPTNGVFLTEKLSVGYDGSAVVPVTPGQVSIRSSDATSDHKILSIIDSNDGDVLSVLQRGQLIVGDVPSPASTSAFVINRGEVYDAAEIRATATAGLKLIGGQDFELNATSTAFILRQGTSYFMTIRDGHITLSDSLGSVPAIVPALAVNIHSSSLAARPAPVLNTATRDNIPTGTDACGALIYNSDTNKYEYYSCSTSSWATIPTANGLPDNKVIFTKNGQFTYHNPFEYNDSEPRLSVPKISVNGVAPNPTSVFLRGDGTNPMYFLNDLGTATDGLKLIALFSRHTPGPGNAGFYAGYYVQGGDVSHTVLFAPGARDFGLTTYSSGQGAANPTIFMKDSNQYVGIGTKIPNAKLHVYAQNESFLGIFETGLSYGGISVTIPNIGIGNRAGISLGKGFNTADSALFAYRHFDNAQKAAEIFVGASPPSSGVSRLRVTPTQVQLQTRDVVIQQGTTVPNTWSRLSYKHGNDVDSPITTKLILASRLRDNFGRSDFSIAINNAATAVEPDELGDSALFIDGLTTRVGIHNTNPEATFDVFGSHRALIDVYPDYAEYAKYIYKPYDREFIQRGQVNIPSFLEHQFEFFASLREIVSFVDPDTWNVAAGTMNDFGTAGGNWTKSGNVYTTSAHRWGWGNQLVLRSAGTRYVTRNLGPFTFNTDRYLIVLMLEHYPSNGTNTRNVLDLNPTAAGSDHIRIRYYNNRLYIDNLTTGQNTQLTYFANGHRTVAVLDLNAATGAVTGYTNRKAGSGNYIRIVTRNNVTLNDGEQFTITLGAANGQSSMNMVVQFFAVLRVSTTVQASEIYRLMKRLSLWYS